MKQAEKILKEIILSPLTSELLQIWIAFISILSNIFKLQIVTNNYLKTGYNIIDDTMCVLRKERKERN